MAQRVMLARALMHQPQVLFLDEPTNNLDPQTRLFLWERIRALHEQGVTIVLTTHDMEEADQLCERIAIMDHGRILKLDAPAELKKLIPGSTTLELQVHIPEVVPAGQGREAEPPGVGRATLLQQALAGLPGVTRAEQPPGWQDEPQQLVLFRLYAEDAGALAGAALHCIAEAGAELRDLHVTRPSLEDVFIYLTGRNLRS
jgi:ABC-2 type transport system ATP-binding protein